MKNVGFFVLMLLGLVSCSSPPKYEKVKLDVPAEFRDSNAWKLAKPYDQQLKQKWWEELGDDDFLKSMPREGSHA